MPDKNTLPDQIHPDDPNQTGAGALAGGALGWLLSAVAVAVPGLGMLLASGPLMAILPQWARAAAGP